MVILGHLLSVFVKLDVGNRILVCAPQRWDAVAQKRNVPTTGRITARAFHDLS